MTSNLPPDPYLALGVSQDATPAEIKLAHRKLVLKNHPDKVTDPALKEAATDAFHKIQTSYEILSDEKRRARYDAEVRLLNLRKENAQDRTSRDAPRATRETRDPPAAARETTTSRQGYETQSRGPAGYAGDYDHSEPLYEVRQPKYASAESYDVPPRATTRKEPRDSDYERPSRRSAPESKEKSRPSGRSEKEAAYSHRRERTRNVEREQRRERDRKYTTYADTTTDDDDSDNYEGMADERRAREAFQDVARKRREEAERGIHPDERSYKLYAQEASRLSHMENTRGASRRQAEADRRPDSGRRPDSDRDRRPESDRYPDIERRSSPPRGSSNRERPQSDARPVYATRQPSSRPQTSGRDDFDLPRRPREERPMSMEESEKSAKSRHPPLQSAKSSPANIHIPADRPPTDKPRAMSLQPEFDLPPPPPRRAETMPHDRGEKTKPIKTEFVHGQPTPGATPSATPTEPPGRHAYGKQYADDHEFPTPDGYRFSDPSYRTEYREPRESARPPLPRRVTRSPSPRDTREPPIQTTTIRPSTSGRRVTTAPVRHGHSSSSNAIPAPPVSMPRSSSYRYDERTGTAEALDRRESRRHGPPPLSRGATTGSGRDLFGAINGSATATAAANLSGMSRTASGSARVATREVRPDDSRHGPPSRLDRRASAADRGRPGVPRSGSGNAVYVR